MFASRAIATDFKSFEGTTALRAAGFNAVLIPSESVAPCVFDVLAVGRQIQVGWIDALWIVASVAYMDAGRYFPLVQSP